MREFWYKQVKGQSETHPLLSPNDEFANYEITSFLIGLPEANGRIPHIVGSDYRQALKDGLTMQDTKGYNPYKLGVAGGSDSHNSASPYRQNNMYGGHGINDGTIETRMSGHLFAGPDVRQENPTGLTGIWAEENTRAHCGTPCGARRRLTPAVRASRSGCLAAGDLALRC